MSSGRNRGERRSVGASESRQLEVGIDCDDTKCVERATRRGISEATLDRAKDAVGGGCSVVAFWIAQTMRARMLLPAGVDADADAGCRAKVEVEVEVRGRMRE